ncbi:bifunctional precorrin-2 dehydrogenase/sirohydrochlorin ferrochelatase [Paenibacillus sp. R14(2021)]|uniref:precorrin-2 dehydrogenase/sirohydrochlorin ferrochelatase family protein n=1 Tax=Paenibacillus sp. R14(2021) TaxID=2859228 RepID=UPI001C615A2E|nr:bifunctional precorrin-2 dehydrogenase/sirohydrochlorin ferrochelatase [Paenibacillus sp. R14(2021)]
MPGYYPMMMKLAGKRCIVVGGGTVAERKVLGLIEGGADTVIVIAPASTERLQALTGSGCIAYVQREYRESDLEGAFLLIAATNDRQLNARIAAAADERGIPVNTADRSELGSFITPAVVKRGDLTIALSTGGASPALTALLKRRLAEQYGPEYEGFLERLHALRKRVLEIITEPGLRTAVLRLAAEELPLFTETADKQARAKDSWPYADMSEYQLEEWMNRLLQAAERGC